MKRSVLINGAILGGFAVLTTGLIGLTHQGTAEKIQQQQQQKLLTTLNAVIPPARYDNDIQHNCTWVTSSELLGSDGPQHVYRGYLDNVPSSAAIEVVAPDGYSGNIHLIVGIADEGTVTGVRVLEHKETPGLGDKIDLRISDWILSFDGQVVADDTLSSWAVRKDGGKFDQFTGATITPRAVVKAVKNAVLFYQQEKQRIFAADNACGSGQE